MNGSEATDVIIQEGLEQPTASTTENALFIGDHGVLPLAVRRILVQLLTGPALDGQRHSKLWPVLIREENLVRRYLAELFLDLIIDQDIQVAFTRQADTGDLDTPRLLRRVQLSFMDSVLMLYLRQRLAQANAQAERAVVSVDDMIADLALYQRVNSTDNAGFAKHVFAAIEKMKKYSLLRKITASSDRFEISPALKLLFSAEEVQALAQVYAQNAKLKTCSALDN